MPQETDTVAIPRELAARIDRTGRRRDAFVAEAVEHELERREGHIPESAADRERRELAEAGFDEWARSLPEEDADSLVDLSRAIRVRWVPGTGFVEVKP